MKILHIISSVNPVDGGPIEGVKQLGAANIRSGHEVEVATLDSQDEPFVKNFPMPLHCFGPAIGKYRYARRIVQWLRGHRREFDAVIVNGLWQFNSYAVYRALDGSDTPYFVYPHGMLDPWFRRRYPLKHLKKKIYWELFQRRAVNGARALLFTCEEERRLARESFGPYGCREIVVNYGTAGPPQFDHDVRGDFEERFPETRGKRCVLFIGRIHEKKGCDLLLRAVAESLKQFSAGSAGLHLIIAGPDDSGWGEALRAMARELGITDRITWTGMLAGELKWGAFAAAEVFILPSHQENFGLAVVEALACGVPVLISRQVNIWREIEADGAGLVENDDQPGVNLLLSRWLKLPSDEQQSMRERAKGSFAKRFEIQQAARSMIDAISKTP